jgi:hypothetical protein
MVLIGTRTTGKRMWATVSKIRGVSRGESVLVHLQGDPAPPSTVGGLAKGEKSPFNDPDSASHMHEPFKSLWEATKDLESKGSRVRQRGWFKSLVYWYLLLQAAEDEKKGSEVDTENLAITQSIKDYFFGCIKKLNNVSAQRASRSRAPNSDAVDLNRSHDEHTNISDPSSEEVHVPEKTRRILREEVKPKMATCKNLARTRR